MPQSLGEQCGESDTIDEKKNTRIMTWGALDPSAISKNGGDGYRGLGGSRDGPGAAR